MKKAKNITHTIYIHNPNPLTELHFKISPYATKNKTIYRNKKGLAANPKTRSFHDFNSDNYNLPRSKVSPSI
jgi:hypothetical protein